MRVIVEFQGESLEFDLPSGRVVAAWDGPPGLDPATVAAAIRDALESPRDFPPLRAMVVPGDRVAVAFDPSTPLPALVLDALTEALGQAGVGREDIWVVAMSPPSGAGNGAGTHDERLVIHDPDDRAAIAYLASTKQGRRVYLNRLLTDADVVIPVGRLGFDSDLGFRGPWSVLFPGLSDRATLKSFRGSAPSGQPSSQGRAAPPRLDEAFEVSWLLGTQFFLGVSPAASGLREVVAGRDAVVREQGIAVVERDWTFTAPSRAELVVAGVGGGAGPIATLADLAAALETATGLVQHGGKVVVLSRAAGSFGPAMQRLAAADDPRAAAEALRGHEDDEDYPIAARFARAAAWADLFIASALDPDVLESLSIVPLERPEHARRLVANSGSTTFLSHAELTFARTAEEAAGGD